MADIKPMLATSSTGASNRRPMTLAELAGTHVFDLKVDGVRAILYRDPTPRLVNRNGVDITHRYPELIDAIDGCGRGLAIDGEILANDGRFETTLLRDQQSKSAAIARLAKAHPCRFIAFDAPEVEGDWERRRGWLEWEVDRFLPDVITVTPYSDDPAFFTQVAQMGMEGVIAKRKTSRYQPGRRSTDWVKFKTVRRVTCIVAGYSPGTGSRKHFGNMTLVMLDADLEPVEVGTVGSGFTEKQTHDLKARLDAGEILVVEIECLNITSGRRLRHPVYKGIRSDLSPIDVTTRQLDELPTC